MKRYKLLILLVFTLTAGCSLFDEKEVKTDDSWPVERIYSEAKSALESGDYTTAIKYYDQLEARFPFGNYAQQALLESSYAHYKNDEPDQAIATLDRFMRVYPLNPNMDYAIYLRGLVNFTRDIGIIEKYVPRDESQRDPGSARLALKDFRTLVKRFPKSKYAEDAAQRIVYLRNRLAQHEVNVAHFYMRRKAFLAAANRAKYVIENYERTPAVPEALTILSKAYKIMGLKKLSDDTLRVLELNYPAYEGIAQVYQTKISP